MLLLAEAGTTHVTTGANAQIGLLVLPFQGINGSAACGRIYLKETGENVGCNLVPGKVYTYSYDVEILHRYPTVTIMLYCKEYREVIFLVSIPVERRSEMGTSRRYSPDHRLLCTASENSAILN